MADAQSVPETKQSRWRQRTGLRRGETLDKKCRHGNHDPVDQHENCGDPLGRVGGDAKIIHQRRQRGIHQRLVQDDDERSGHERRPETTLRFHHGLRAR